MNVKIKTLKSIYALLFLPFLIFGCSESKLRFTEPQPKFGKTITEFPKNIWGKYSAIEDSSIIISLDNIFSKSNNKCIKPSESFITINDKSIINQLNGSITIDFDELDSLEKIQYSNGDFYDNTIKHFFNHPNYFYVVQEKTDSSSTCLFDIQDTLFYFSTTNVAKKYRGKMYLSMEDSLEYWNVIQLEKQKENITFNYTSESDKSLLIRLLRNNSESYDIYGKTRHPNSFTPSKKTFKKFLKMGGFEDKTELKRKID